MNWLTIVLVCTFNIILVQLNAIDFHLDQQSGGFYEFFQFQNVPYPYFRFIPGGLYFLVKAAIDVDDNDKTEYAKW